MGILKDLTLLVDMVIFSAPANARLKQYGLGISFIYGEGNQ